LRSRLVTPDSRRRLSNATPLTAANTLRNPVASVASWILIDRSGLTVAYAQSRATAAVRLETGYPVSALDMVYFFPALLRKDGKPIGATQAVQQIDGRTFQRWSRHRTPQNPWKAGQDSLGSHVALIEDWLEREFGR
jgi:Prokaryotic E2 family E